MKWIKCLKRIMMVFLISSLFIIHTTNAYIPTEPIETVSPTPIETVSPTPIETVSPTPIEIAEMREIRGNVAVGDGPQTWDGRNFLAFYYDIDNDIAPENMNIITSVDNRSISNNTLVYSTNKIPRTYKIVENGHNISDIPDGKYYMVSAFGQPNVAINGDATKLSKLLIEQDDEKKILGVGESWNIREWNLNVQSTNTEVMPRQAILTLSKNGIKVDEKIVNQSDIYVYKENDEPMFITYIDTIFSGYLYKVIQLKYTWAISPSIFEIHTGDTRGNAIVDIADTDHIQVSNINAINLTKGNTVDAMENIKFRVADSDILRYYPIDFATTRIEKIRPANVAVDTEIPVVLTNTTSCDSSYPDFCVPPPPPDLNCIDVSYKNFKVLQPDPHGFDSDNDGIGCES